MTNKKRGIILNLTYKECELLISIFNAGIKRAMESGIPIGKEHYQNIDIIKGKLYQELAKGAKYDTNS